MTLNGYIKRWQQKAFMVEVSGCIEHSTLIFEALKEAKEEYRSICLAMLDFANAYGYNLIYFAMEWYHFLPWLCKLIFCYYDKIFAFCGHKNWSTDFFALQIGLFQGCCMSVMIFNIVFKMLFIYFSREKELAIHSKKQK